MKTKVLISLLLTAALFALLAGSAAAQDPRYVSGDYTVGSALKFIPENTATNVMAYSTAIDVRKTMNITFTGKFKRGAAGTNTFLIFATGPDGSNWPTNVNHGTASASMTAGAQNGLPLVWTIPDTATAGDAGGIVLSTNFNVSAAGFIKLHSAALAYDADQAFTNVWIKYSYKISTP
jgi:hypothetical protein